MESKLKNYSQTLRKNPTKEENHLWYDFLRNYPVQFRRQVPFGQYIVDFYCSEAKLAVELDGSQHYEAQNLEYDQIRSEYLERNYGLRILRFTNLDVKERFEGVCIAIEEAIKQCSPSSVPCGDTFPPEWGRLDKEESIMKQVTIYTDGACSGNPGPGGWGAILKYGQAEKEMGGGEPNTTNNRMELLGVINALSALKEPCQVDLYSDSQYICNAINQHWLEGWKKAGWKRKGGELKNPDLWKTLDQLLHVHSVTFHWVKGHADNAYNNRCDQIAVREREKFA